MTEVKERKKKKEKNPKTLNRLKETIPEISVTTLLSMKF